MRERVVRSSAFVRSEMVESLRQPRLLALLVLGPFLVLLLFGLGYRESIPALSTVVVGADSDLTDRVDEFIRSQEPAGLDYRGTTADREGALAQLRDGQVDLVVILPDRAMDTLGRSERAVIEVHQRSLDPITSSQVVVSAQMAVSEINDKVLEEVVGQAQSRSADLEQTLGEARAQLDRARAAVDAGDIRALQRTAGGLADRLVQLADAMRAGAGISAQLGLTQPAQLEQQLRTTADRLRQVAAIDAVGRLDEAASTLARMDEVVTQLRNVKASVVVRPFQADVVSETPEPVTLDRFYAPGLFALMLQHVGVTFAALALIRDRRYGALELLDVAPVTTGERLAGKTVAFLALGSLLAALLTVLVVTVFGVPLPMDWGSFVGIVLLTLLSSLGLGYLIASVSSSHSQAVQFAMLLLLAAIFFSGLFMPLDRMGMPAVAVSWLMPATYAFRGFQDLMLLQQPTRLWYFLALVGGSLVSFAVVRPLLARRRA